MLMMGAVDLPKSSQNHSPSEKKSVSEKVWGKRCNPICLMNHLAFNANYSLSLALSLSRHICC